MTNVECGMTNSEPEPAKAGTTIRRGPDSVALCARGVLGVLRCDWIEDEFEKLRTPHSSSLITTLRFPFGAASGWLSRCARLIRHSKFVIRHLA